jgi:hypothetical protein
MPEKRGKAETPTTVQREHVPEAIAGQDDADQEGRDDHVAKANPDNGDEATKLLDVEIQTRPKKPMIMVFGPVLMNTYGDDNGLPEEEFVYMERDIMGDMGVAN